MVLSLKQHLGIYFVLQLSQLLWSHENFAIKGGSYLYLCNTLHHLTVQVPMPLYNGVDHCVHTLLFDTLTFVPKPTALWLCIQALVVNLLHHIDDLLEI